MREPFVEYRKLQDQSVSSLAKDVVRHLYPRQFNTGFIIVITHHPLTLLRMIRKHWLKLEKSVARERSSTIDMHYRNELQRISTQMLGLHFSTKISPSPKGMGIFFLSSLQPAQQLPACHTIYVTTCEIPAKKAQVHLIDSGLLVTYHNILE